jgi:hypothetical protein
MKKSELKRIIQEELKGYSKYAPEGETKGGTTDDFRNILTTIAKQGTEEETPIKEEASNIESINISYAYPGNRLYSITINGKKALDKEEAIQTVQDLTGLEVPSRAWFDDKEVLAIVDALKAKGIQASSSEMDVS